MSDRFDEEAAAYLSGTRWRTCPEHTDMSGCPDLCTDCAKRAIAARPRADAAEIARLRAVVDAARVVYAMLDESCANGAEADALGSALAALDAKEDR